MQYLHVGQFKIYAIEAAEMQREYSKKVYDTIYYNFKH